MTSPGDTPRLSRLLANIHDVDVMTYPCDSPGNAGIHVVDLLRSGLQPIELQLFELLEFSLIQRSPGEDL